MSGSGDTVLVDMPVGEYTIAWIAVSGYYEPLGQAKTLALNDTITFIGRYTKGWMKTLGGPGYQVG